MKQASNHSLFKAGPSYFPDRWIALSSLQKSIRRGALEPATAAASALWSEPSRLLDRLLVIGLEDIGVGDLDVLQEIIELTTDRAWRRKLPDKGKSATLGLVGRMCLATKSRFSDELLAIAALEPALGPVRDKLMAASDREIMDCVTFSEDIGARAVALWFLAGTARYPMDRAPRRPGSLAPVWDAATSFEVPADALHLLDRAARRIRRPLAVLLPLAYASKAGGTPIELVKNVAVEMRRHVPLYALDQFTRRGLVAIGRWLADCPALQDILRAAAAEPDWVRITRYVVFAVESQLCSRHLMWAEQQDVLRRSVVAELTGRGLAADYVDPLLDCAMVNLAALNDQRRELMDGASA